MAVANAPVDSSALNERCSLCLGYAPGLGPRLLERAVRSAK